MPNTQLPESPIGDDTYIDLHSMFFTLQGEGPFSGRRALFIRLAGCNLQCPGCDTEYTQGRTRIPYTELIEDVIETTDTSVLVVITGGEPFRQDLTVQLVWELAVLGYTVQVETNGTLFPHDMHTILEEWPNVHIVCSPKTPSITRGLERALLDPVAGARVSFKYVVDAQCNADDGLPLLALENPNRTRVYRPPYLHTAPHRIYVQPYDVDGDPARTAANRNATVDAAKAHGFTLQLQIHKLLELP